MSVAKSMTVNKVRLIRAVLRKDLRTEARSRVVLNQVLPFAGIVLVMFAFALDSDSILSRVAPGLIWLTTSFAMLLVVQRSFALESADGALDALRVAGIDMMAVFLGKAMAIIVQLMLLDLVLVLMALVLYRVNPPASGIPLIVVTVLLSTAGLGFIGILYGGLTVGAKGRETLLPLLILPVVAPVVIAATRATESAMGTSGRKVAEGWPWVGLLGFIAVSFGIIGALAFPPLVEE